MVDRDFVGLVIVSHSRALAEALAQLAAQVAGENAAPLALAAGVGEGRKEFGTDAVEIMEAIQQVDSPAGVLVLMDLGSAVLSAEMAVELLPPETAARVRFSSGPLVEGVIAAAVQAGLGSDLDTVAREAAAALTPKAEHLGQSGPAAAVPPAPAAEKPAGEWLTTTATLRNRHGLHARPAARFVAAAGASAAEILLVDLTNGKGPVSARSLNAVATLGAIEGHTVELRGRGPGAAETLARLAEMIASGFGEVDAAAPPQAAAPVPAAAAPAGAQIGAAASEGAALGPLWKYRLPEPEIPSAPSTDRAADWARLEAALARAEADIQTRRADLARRVGEAEAAIFDAHRLILRDPELRAAARAAILEGGQNPAAAWWGAIEAAADRYAALDDPYMQARAADVRDVGRQALAALGGAPAGKIELPGEVILFAPELTPSETVGLDMGRVLAIVTSGGGPTSHSAILARSLGIPAVAGVNLEGAVDGVIVGVDGWRGAVWLAPEAMVQEELTARRAEWLAERARLQAASAALATTADGTRIEVAANIGSAADAARAVASGAEAVGLLRTEFLYLTRQTPPSEDEQLASLLEIGAAMQGRPIVARTLDVGGDKALPYIDLPPEANPFLGVRAVRLSLTRPDLFQPQLRAILRAAGQFPYRVMFPMVANLSEVEAARAALAEAHAALTAAGVAHGWPIPTGIMVEIPAAALLAEKLAPAVDFFSIGTNDLTQYTLAAERGSPALAGLADAFHPAVLRLIGEVCAAAHAHGKWVGVCGELAGDPLAAPILVGLGVDELSMNPGAIGRVKALLRDLTLADAQERARRVLATTSAAAARLAAS